jgi:hypothetical protein
MLFTNLGGSIKRQLKIEYADYNIIEVSLPVEKHFQIGFKATTFYSKDIREAWRGHVQY